MTRLLAATALAALLTGPLAGAAGAETIRATSGFGPAHIQATDAYPEINARLKEYTNGAWDLQDTPSGLVSPAEMNTALRDGVSEMGTLLLPYFPADYPESSITAELTSLGSSNKVVAAAAAEYVATCAECQAEFARGGQVFTGADATPLYNLLTTKPVRTAADLNGMRIRTGAPYYAALVESLGGSAAQMPSAELFEALSQGVVDGTFSGNHEIIANRLGDVIKYVTEIKAGIFNGAVTASTSYQLWNRMTPEERQALIRAIQHGIAKGLFAFERDAEKARETAGIEFIEPDASLTEARDKFAADYLTRAAGILEGRGIKDAQAKIDRYKGLIDKWEGLTKDVTTPDALAELMYNEIYAKLDFSTYGQP